MIEAWDAIRVLVATLVFAAAVAGLGSVVRGKGGTPAGDLGAGLGVLGIATMLLARGGLGLGTSVWIMLGAGLCCFAFSAQTMMTARFGRSVAVLHLPMVALTAAIPLVAWDDFSHWLPNALFLLRWDAFPGPGLPPPESIHGTYPPGSALVTFSVSLIGRSFLGLGAVPETAAPIMTVLLFGALAACLGGVFERHIRSYWLGAVLALLCVFWANPGFIPRIVFTNYADAPTAALLGIALIVALYGLERRDIWSALQAGFILAAVVNLKQTGFVVAGLGFAGVILVILLDSQSAKVKRVSAATLALIPAFLVWVLWRHHASAATGGFSVKPLAEWVWHLAPQTLSSMGKVAISKAAYTAAILGAAAVAIVKLKRRNLDLLGAASLVVALGAFGWAFVLFLTYMGTSFNEVEIVRAASFWRYMSQFSGPVGVVLAIALVEWNWLRGWVIGFGARLPAVLSARAGLWSALLVLFLPLLTLNHLWPLPREPAPPLRRAALELAPIVRGNAPVVVIDPRGNGMSHVALAFGWRGVAPTIWFGDAYRVESFPTDEVLRRVERAGARFVMLVSTDREVERAFATPGLPSQHWRLLKLEDGAWKTAVEGAWR
jgi:hypothetical protein